MRDTDDKIYCKSCSPAMKYSRLTLSPVAIFQRHPQWHSKLWHNNSRLRRVLHLLAGVSPIPVAPGPQDPSFVHGQGIFCPGRRDCLLHLGDRSSQRPRPDCAPASGSLWLETRVGLDRRDHGVDFQLRNLDRQRPRFQPFRPEASRCIVVPAPDHPDRVRRHLVHRADRLVLLDRHLRHRDLEPSGPAVAILARRRLERRALRRLHDRRGVRPRTAGHQHRRQQRFRRHRSDRAAAALPEHPPWRLHLRRRGHLHVSVESAQLVQQLHHLPLGLLRLPLLHRRRAHL